MDPMAVIEKFYPSGSALNRILVDHSRQVAEKSLDIARKLADPDLDLGFIEQAAMLHDIGIFLTASPKIGCTGQAPYLCHGVLGRELLDSEGLDPAYGLVAERHTGAGISLDTILRHNLPLPHRDLVPETLEEKIVCCADKFFSKTGPARHRPRTISQILADLTDIDPEHAHRFSRWAEAFRL
jgi:uncharacterized protein